MFLNKNRCDLSGKSTQKLTTLKFYFIVFKNGNLAGFCTLPFEVHSGDVEDDSLQPEDHEDSLRKRTVSDALSITAGL